MELERIRKILLKWLSGEDSKYLSARELFDGAINMARKSLKDDPYLIYDMIRLHGKRIQYDYLSDFLKHAGLEEFYDERTKKLKALEYPHLWINAYDDSFAPDEFRWFLDEVMHRGQSRDGQTTADLNFDVVLPWPWRGSRLTNCLKSIGEGKSAGAWQYDDLNHTLDYWEEIGIFFVHSGNHSIATGIMKSTGSLPSRHKTDMSFMYKYIKSDGAYYYKKDGDSLKKLCDVVDPNFAIIYELGRLAVENDLNYQEYKKMRLMQKCSKS